MIPSSVREEVRARTDLADLVGQYVPLRRSGSSLVARCPFHQEKSPSFHVSRERGLFHCFGCKVSGDVFSFYERIEGVSFPEALRALAARAGVQIEEVRDTAAIAEEKRSRELSERLYHACDVAAQFFRAALTSAELSEMARDELTERGVTDDSAERFLLGYAPAEWDALAKHLVERGVSPADAEMAGLVSPRKHGGGYYDRFRHRLMFPIWDRNGKVVAFSGRILPATEFIPEGIVPAETGKYINSPETPIYRKSELLFGLQAARAAMRQSAEAVMVEGNFDVVAMHQHGFANTVAPLGTSFTDQQARLLRRFAEEVTLVFDADEAGRKAARAAHQVCARAGLIARVVILHPDKAKDPDELLRKPGGRDYLADRMKHAPSIVEWLIEDAASRCGDTIPEQVEALRTIAPVLLEVRDGLERGAYVEKVARLLPALDRRQVLQAVREAERAVRAGPVDPFDTAPAAPRPVPRDEPFRRGESENAPAREDNARFQKADAITALLRSPALLASEHVDALLTLLDDAFGQPLVAEARKQWLSRGELDGAALLALAPSDKAKAWLSERIVPAADADPESEDRNRQTLVDSITRLKSHQDRDAARRLRQESARARAAGDHELEYQLLKKAELIDKQRAIPAAKRNRGAA